MPVEDMFLFRSELLQVKSLNEAVTKVQLELQDSIVDFSRSENLEHLFWMINQAIMYDHFANNSNLQQIVLEEKYLPDFDSNYGDTQNNGDDIFWVRTLLYSSNLVVAAQLISYSVKNENKFLGTALFQLGITKIPFSTCATAPFNFSLRFCTADVSQALFELGEFLEPTKESDGKNVLDLLEIKKRMPPSPDKIYSNIIELVNQRSTIAIRFLKTLLEKCNASQNYWLLDHLVVLGLNPLNPYHQKKSLLVEAIEKDDFALIEHLWQIDHLLTIDGLEGKLLLTYKKVRDAALIEVIDKYQFHNEPSVRSFLSKLIKMSDNWTDSNFLRNVSNHQTAYEIINYFGDTILERYYRDRYYWDRRYDGIDEKIKKAYEAQNLMTAIDILTKVERCKFKSIFILFVIKSCLKKFEPEIPKLNKHFGFIIQSLSMVNDISELPEDSIERKNLFERVWQVYFMYIKNNPMWNSLPNFLRQEDQISNKLHEFVLAAIKVKTEEQFTNLRTSFSVSKEVGDMLPSDSFYEILQSIIVENPTNNALNLSMFFTAKPTKSDSNENKVSGPEMFV